MLLLSALGKSIPPTVYELLRVVLLGEMILGTKGWLWSDAVLVNDMGFVSEKRGLLQSIVLKCFGMVCSFSRLAMPYRDLSWTALATKIRQYREAPATIPFWNLHFCTVAHVKASRSSESWWKDFGESKFLRTTVVGWGFNSGLSGGKRHHQQKLQPLLHSMSCTGSSSWNPYFTLMNTQIKPSKTTIALPYQSAHFHFWVGRGEDMP